MIRKWILPSLVAFLAVCSFSSFAGSSDHHVSGPQAALAARAAIAYVGGQWATIARPGTPGIAWQFHVVRRDGSATEVLMDENLELVDAGGHSQTPALRLAQSTPGASQRALRAAKAVPQIVRDRAGKAALEATGGGRVADVDEDRENGAAWEVEVITPDGRSVDVLLDANFRVLETGDETDPAEPAKSGANGRGDTHH